MMNKPSVPAHPTTSKVHSESSGEGNTEKDRRFPAHISRHEGDTGKEVISTLHIQKKITSLPKKSQLEIGGDATVGTKNTVRTSMPPSTLWVRAYFSKKLWYFKKELKHFLP
jgi:hypothetical protein